jgi:inosose dehydratase
MRYATGPVSWGVDFADAPANPPWPLVLDEIAASPLDALELGPVGYLPEDPEVIAEELGRRGLSAVGSFVFEPFHDRAAAKAILEVTRRACRAIAAAGGRVLVIIDRPDRERGATAGRSDAARRLSPHERTPMLRVIRQAASIADAYGLRAALHPHAGGYVEFADEIDEALAATGVDLCVDTGHCAYAGVDPAALIAEHRTRLGHVHLKDVRPDVLERARAERRDFWTAIEDGVFCPLGTGMVDLPAVLDALQVAGYEGVATIEQDRVPGSGAPLDDLAASLSVLADAQRLRGRR